MKRVSVQLINMTELTVYKSTSFSEILPVGNYKTGSRVLRLTGENDKSTAYHIALIK